MVDNIERIAAVIGMLIVTVFLLGLGDAIHETPFWVIVVGVLCLAWYGVYEECFKNAGKKGDDAGA
ncbi:MAG: hypothetical protein RIC16_10200 [Rhodospirillales bacterium]